MPTGGNAQRFIESLFSVASVVSCGKHRAELYLLRLLEMDVQTLTA